MLTRLILIAERRSNDNQQNKQDNDQSKVINLEPTVVATTVAAATGTIITTHERTPPYHVDTTLYEFKQENVRVRCMRRKAYLRTCVNSVNAKKSTWWKVFLIRSVLS